MPAIKSTRRSRRPKRRFGPVIFDQHGNPLDPNLVAKKLAQAINRFHSGADRNSAYTPAAVETIHLPAAPKPCPYRQGLLDIQFRLDGRPATSKAELEQSIDLWFDRCARATSRLGFDDKAPSSLHECLADFLNDDVLVRKLPQPTRAWLFDNSNYGYALATTVLKMALAGRLDHAVIIQQALVRKIESDCRKAFINHDSFVEYSRLQGDSIAAFAAPYVDGPKPAAQGLCQAMAQLNVFEADQPEALIPTTIALARRAKAEGWYKLAQPLTEHMQTTGVSAVAVAKQALVTVTAKWAAALKE